MTTVRYDEIWKNPAAHFKSEIPVEIARLFSEHEVRSVLDLGSGDGKNIIALAKQGFKCTGLEFSAEGVKRTLTTAQQEHCNVDVKQADMYQPLSYQVNSFDAVIGLQSINHNNLQKILELIKEVHRVLCSTGLFCIKVADRASFKLKHMHDNIWYDEDFNEEFEFLDEQTMIPLTGDEKGMLHYAFYEKQLENIMRDNNFKVLSISKTKFHIVLCAQKL